MSTPTLFLSVEDVLYLHDQLASSGLRDPAALEAAVMLPRQREDGNALFPTVEEMAAALQGHLLETRPFHKGNRSTALLAAYSFLRIND